MNDKETALHKIVDIVVGCCVVNIDGRTSITKEDVLGKSKAESVVMTRCVLVRMISFAGFSKETSALLLHKSQQAVRHLLALAQQYHSQSRAYRIAEAEATLRCKEISAI